MQIRLAGSFRLFQSGFRVLHELVRLAPVVRIKAKPHFTVTAISRSSTTYGRSNTRMTSRWISCISRSVSRSSGKTWHERAASQVSQTLRVGILSLQPAGNGLQQPVARGTPEGIVGHTQMIDIEHHHGEPGRPLSPPYQPPAEPLTEQRAVGEARQRIEKNSGNEPRPASRGTAMANDRLPATSWSSCNSSGPMRLDSAPPIMKAPIVV